MIMTTGRGFKGGERILSNCCVVKGFGGRLCLAKLKVCD